MPINIIDYSNVAEGEAGEKIDWLCDDVWELPEQLRVLEGWLLSTGLEFGPGSYVADIGFTPREGAAGGGGVLSVDSMKVLSSIGMAVYFSEYPMFEDGAHET